MRPTFRGVLFLSVMAVALGVQFGRAGWSLGDWLKQLDAKVRRVDDKRQGRLAASAAVRGAKNDESAKGIYWKGKKASGPAPEAEWAEFKAALTLAQQGKTAEAKTAFSAFLDKHPQSSMAPDAKETLSLLSQEAPAPVQPVQQP